MLVYIASYPKSGNTWVRAILRTLTSSKLDINNINLGVNSASKKFTGTVVYSNIIKINKIVRYTRYKKYVDSDEIKYLKVHDAFDKELFPDKTKAIVVVRNPLDVAISYSHYNGITIDSAIHAINNPENIFKESEMLSRQYLGSWKDNTESWLSSDNNVLLIKYEDLLKDVKQETIRISEFLNIAYTEELLDLVKHETSFKNMKEQEKKFGFKEKPKKCNVFFRTGEKDQYKYRMTKEQIKSVIDYNKETMIKLGYLEE